MANRFTRNDDDDTGSGGAVASRERVTGDRAAGSAPVRDGDGHGAGDTMSDVRARQRNEFGGFNWGSDFFGWLVAVGLGAILTGILSAAGAVIGLNNKVSAGDAKSNADTIGIVGGVLLLIVLMVAYYCGGYVAGRMSRFDGARNGFGVWLIGLIITVILGAAAAILGAEYNVLQNLNLPTLPVDGQSLSTGGLIATAAVIVGTILAAVVGGKAGERFHKKVDREGFNH
jgi:amino acid transporter